MSTWRPSAWCASRGWMPSRRAGAPWSPSAASSGTKRRSATGAAAPGSTAFSLDLKLGGRMLVKYPGLTIVGGLAMAFAICVGTVIFQVLALFLVSHAAAARRRSHRRHPQLGRRGQRRRAARAVRLRRLARHAAVGDGARCLARRHAQPDRRRRRCASRRGRGDHRVRLSRRRRCAAHGPRPGGGRRADRGATGRRDRLRGVAHALRQRSRVCLAAACSLATST